MLILDEPTIGLDPRQIAEIRALIKSLAGQHTVILSTHILPEVSMVCDGVIIINRGRIVAQGTESELVEQVFPAARVEVRGGGRRRRPWPARGGRDAGRAWAWSRSAPATAASGFVVESARGRDVRARAGPARHRARAGRSSSCTRSGMTLEEVFIRVVAGEEEPHEPVPASAEEEAR